MTQLALKCVLDIKTEWNPQAGVQRRTTFKYREGNIDLDVSRHCTETIRCPSCASAVTFTVYPGLPFSDALALAWQMNRKAALWFLLAGAFLSLLFLPLGLLVGLGAGWTILFDDISCGLTSNRKLKIVDSTGMNQSVVPSEEERHHRRLGTFGETVTVLSSR